MSISRRSFLKGSIAAGTVMTFFGKANAAAVAESDPQAKTLGYVTNATKADKAKFPKYAAGQACNNCMMYQGKAGAPAGPCPIFGGKDVSASGWCSAYAKKA